MGHGNSYCTIIKFQLKITHEELMFIFQLKPSNKYYLIIPHFNMLLLYAQHLFMI